MHKTARQAREAGDKHYKPDHPCRHGHDSPRQVSGSCLECLRVRNKARHHGCSVWEILVAESFFDEMAQKNSIRSGVALHTRDEAIRKGMKTYFDGIPCRVRGHVSERYASNKGCMMCWKEDCKNGRYAESSRKWRQENMESHKASIKRWREENRDRTNMSAANRRAAMHNRDICHDNDLMDLCVTEAYQHCRDMGEKLGGRWEVDHMIPLLAEEVSGLHVPCNIQVIPQMLNASKQNRMLYTEDLEWLADATSEE